MLMVHKLAHGHHPYIVLRKQTYYFRMRLPAHIRLLSPSLPVELKRSLFTDSLKDAVVLVNQKLSLIRLLQSCHEIELVNDLCRKIFDFSSEIGGWVRKKLEGCLAETNTHAPRAMEAMQSNNKANIPVLSAAWQDFVGWKSWTDKQGKANQRTFDNLLFFLGDVRVDLVTKAKLKSALTCISQLPQRNKKSYKILSLDDLIAMKIPDEDIVSGKYVTEHLKLCQSLFSRYLTDEVDILKVSPTLGLKWQHDDNRYASLSDADIRNVMTKSSDKPEWFQWFLLMSVYSGARRGELAGLSKSDFKLCQDTQRSYFVIRSGKTKAARRIVPIHHNLIELGLLAWVEARDDLVFDTAMRNPNRVTDLFGTLLDSNVNDFGERIVLHSLRHTFITKSRAAGNSDVLVQQVVGHEKRGAGQTDRYTHTFQLKDILSVIDSIDYSLSNKY